MLLPAGPLLVAAQLPDSNPVKKSALAYVDAYEKANGAGSTNTFGDHMWDAGQLVVAALPVALKSGAKPGTPEFRAAMRDALEGVKDLAASQGVFNMSPTDHAALTSARASSSRWKAASGSTSQPVNPPDRPIHGCTMRRRRPGARPRHPGNASHRPFRPVCRISVPDAAGAPRNHKVVVRWIPQLR